MRVLHLSTRLILGGSQENTVLSCEGQARPPYGHDVHLGFGPIYGPEGSLLGRVEAFNAAGHGRIGIHVVPHMLRQVSPRNDVRCRRELIALIRELKPDIVHTHSSKAGILGRAAAWEVQRRDKRPIGIIHTIHGPPFMPIEGSALRQLKIRAINHLYTIAERRAARQCHLIVSVAYAMTEQFLARRIGDRRRYVTVYSGMDVDRYLNAAAGGGEDRASIRRELGLAPGDFVVGTVARLAEHKGHDDLLDALGDPLRANPRWKLLWVGDGWWRPRLEQRLRAEGLAGSVVIAGLVPSDRVAAMMRAMDVLAHPSYREGLPRTVPQALLCGVPVIAHDVDGTSEACLDPSRVGTESATGLLVRPGDRVGLRAGVEWMAEHPQERAAMAARGRALCRERFSAATMVRDLEVVYARALEMARNG